MIVLDLDERLENLGTKARELGSYTSLRINMVRTLSYQLGQKSNFEIALDAEVCESNLTQFWGPRYKNKSFIYIQR
jgi:hypothetical protein